MGTLGPVSPQNHRPQRKDYPLGRGPVVPTPHPATCQAQYRHDCARRGGTELPRGGSLVSRFGSGRDARMRPGSGETEGVAKAGHGHVLGQLALWPLSPVRGGGAGGPSLLPVWAPFLCDAPTKVPSSLRGGSESVFLCADPLAITVLWSPKMLTLATSQPH